MRYSNALRYRAVRHFKDARNIGFDVDQDIHVDGFLDHLKKHAPKQFKALVAEAKRTTTTTTTRN